MSSKVKDIDIKTEPTTFLMILSILEILIQIILKQIKIHAKRSSFTTLNMLRSKIQNT